MLSFVLEWFETENSVEEKHMEYAALAAVSYVSTGTKQKNDVPKGAHKQHQTLHLGRLHRCLSKTAGL